MGIRRPPREKRGEKPRARKPVYISKGVIILGWERGKGLVRCTKATGGKVGKEEGGRNVRVVVQVPECDVLLESGEVGG